MKKLIFISSIFIFLLFGQQSHAQQFKSAIGARLGYPLSVSYKTHLNESNAIEIIAGTAGTRGFSGSRWWNVSAAYQIHKPLNIDGVEGLQYYFGAGASAFFWSFDDSFIDESSVSFGAQGYLGAQYTFDDVPISITVDWVPTIFFSGLISGFGGAYGGVGVRYVLGERLE